MAERRRKEQKRISVAKDETDEPQSLLPALIIDFLSQIIEGHIRH